MVYILFIPPKALCKKNPRSRRRDLYFVVLVIRKGFEPLTYILFFSIFTLLIISVLLYGFIVQFLIVWHKTDAFLLSSKKRFRNPFFFYPRTLQQASR